MAIIKDSTLENPVKSYTFLYQPDSISVVSDVIEINGIMAEIPIVSINEKIIINTIKIKK
jgi:hypothetical protein